MLEILLRHYIETPPGGSRLARRRRDRRHARRHRRAPPAGRQAAGSFCAKRKPTYNVHTHMILQSADDGSAKLHNGRLVPFLNSSTTFTEMLQRYDNFGPVLLHFLTSNPILGQDHFICHFMSC